MLARNDLPEYIAENYGESRKRPFHENLPLYINIVASLVMLGLVIGYFV